MQNTWKTPEFWAALVGQIIGLVVLFGGVTEVQGAEIGHSLEAIIGGILSIMTVLGYLKSQAARKTAAVEILKLKTMSAPRDPALLAQHNANAALDKLLAQI